MGLSGYFIINGKLFQHNIAVGLWPLDELEQELLAGHFRVEFILPAAAAGEK